MLILLDWQYQKSTFTVYFISNFICFLSIKMFQWNLKKPKHTEIKYKKITQPPKTRQVLKFITFKLPNVLTVYTTIYLSLF